jgi:hypothetical protein
LERPFYTESCRRPVHSPWTTPVAAVHNHPPAVDKSATRVDRPWTTKTYI